MFASNLLDFSYWFGLQPPVMLPLAVNVLLVGFAVMVLAGVGLRMVPAMRTKDRFTVQTFDRFGRLLRLMGVLGLLILFFSYERIYFFGMRAWFAVWGIGLIAWAVWLTRYAVHRVPALRVQDQARRAQDPYLPRKKR